MSEPFFFGVPLIARAAAGDWGLVDRLFALTLRSVLAQRDGAFTAILAGHDRPPAWDRLTAGDPRFRFLPADWPVAAPTAANDDGGTKKWAIKAAVRVAGGGLLMFLDADDWVDRDLVGAARAAITADHVGGIVDDGVAVDWASGRATRFPIPGGFEGGFDGLCGSSTVARIDPASSDPVRFDPHLALGSHGDWAETAARDGHRLARLGVQGAYLTGTGHSHSEQQGPYAEWRRALSAQVRELGRPLTPGQLERFGLDAALFAARDASAV